MSGGWTAGAALECENPTCGAVAPSREAGSAFYRPENVILTPEELVEMGWFDTGTGWLCPECVPG